MKRLSLLMFALVLGACGLGGPKEAEEALKDKGVLDVLEEASKDRYDPPADGRLTEKQVRMYLEVKKRERDLAKAAAEQLKAKGQALKEAEKEGAGLSTAWQSLGALKDLSNLVTADIRAAQELGHNTAEYTWVKEQILEAGLATWTDNIRQQTSGSLEMALQQMKDARAQAPNEEMRKFYDEQIANYEQALSEEEEQASPSEATQYNLQLIKKFSDELKLLEEEIQKYGLASSLGRDDEQQ